MNPVIETVVTINGVELSAKMAKPQKQTPKAVVLAIPGGGYTSGYWHNALCMEASLLLLGASLGYQVIALDRPGYGISAGGFAQGMELQQQSGMIADLVHELAEQSSLGVFLIGHSLGGVLSLMATALQRENNLLALDVSGVPRHFSERLTSALQATFDEDNQGTAGRGARAIFYGPEGTFNPLLQRQRDPSSCESPLSELSDSINWPDLFPEVAEKIVVPVQYTLGEFEHVTRCDWEALHETGRLFSSSPRVQLHRQVNAGHNISLHYVGRAYHLRALAFFDEVLLQS